MGSIRYDFTGKTVLVTGASRGIGRGVARAFAGSGADVFIMASGAGVADAAAAIGAETGRTVTGLRCDITDGPAVRAALDRIDRLDVLVNNAGLERITPLADAGEGAEAMFRRVIDVNVIGTYLVTRHAAPKLPRGGRVILTASIWSRTAVAEFSAYVASKHANLGFMRAIAHELGPRDITVNAVCPGWIRTDAAMRSLGEMAKRSGKAEDELLGDIVSAQVLGGLMEPDDVASLYLFLASDGAANITGQAYHVDRGEVMA